MVEKENGFISLIKNGLSNLTKAISESIFSPIVDNTEKIIKNIEDKLLLMEKRIIRKISSLLIMGFGAILLIFALFFFLIESLNWNKAEALFAIGIIILIIGLLLRKGEQN